MLASNRAEPGSVGHATCYVTRVVPLRLDRKAGLRPDQALYLGNDMLNDVWTAGQAGLLPVLFAGDQRSLRLREDDPRCRDLRPARVLTALDQLPALLDR